MKFIVIPEWLVTADLPWSAKGMYAVIVNYVGDNEVAWPSIKTLAQRMHLSADAVIDSIRRLEGAGLLIVNRATRGKVNQYRLPKEHGKTDYPEKPGTRKNPVEPAGKTQLNQPEKPTLFRSNELDPMNKIHPEARKDALPRFGKKSSPRATPDSDWAQAQKFLSLGSSLDTDEFRTAWAEWCQYRRDRRSGLTSQTVKRQIAFLEREGHDKAIGSIDQSLEGGWLRLVEIKGQGPAGKVMHSRIRAPKGKYDDVPTIVCDANEIQGD